MEDRKVRRVSVEAVGSIVEYFVASEHQLEKMVSVVNGKISEGWQPFGGIQVVVPVLEGDGPAPLYSQAMVRYAKPGQLLNNPDY